MMVKKLTFESTNTVVFPSVENTSQCFRLAKILVSLTENWDSQICHSYNCVIYPFLLSSKMSDLILLLTLLFITSLIHHRTHQSTLVIPKHNSAHSEYSLIASEIDSLSLLSSNSCVSDSQILRVRVSSVRV